MNQQTKISAEIVAHTINEMGDDLVSFELTFPRIILSELNSLSLNFIKLSYNEKF